jgi:Phosphotransferase enzyme family
MEFQEKISVNNKVFKLLNDREHQDIAIYKQGNNFLRLGDHEQIANEIKKHNRLASYQFPVPEIIEQGTLNDLDYYTELSLGNKHFGELFAEDIKKQGVISEATFKAFLKISLVYAEAQLSTRNKKQNFTAFAKLIHLELAVVELSQHKKQILELYKAAEEKLSVFPFVLTHGDFTPHNLYKKGVIDFEFQSLAPAGYDLVSNIITVKYFPKGKQYEFYRSYDYTSDQIKQYWEAIDNLYRNYGLPAPSKYYKYFGFCRAMWHICRMGQYPKLQKYRFDLFIRSYLS